MCRLRARGRFGGCSCDCRAGRPSRLITYIQKSWKFPDFARALEFVNHLGVLAEEQGHHPWIHFTWGVVKVLIGTHEIDGLTESDFVPAAKIDRLLPS